MHKNDHDICYRKHVHHLTSEVMISTDHYGLLNHLWRIDCMVKGFSSVIYRPRKGEFIAIRWDYPLDINIDLCLTSPRFSLPISQIRYFILVFPNHLFTLYGITMNSFQIRSCNINCIQSPHQTCVLSLMRITSQANRHI